MTDDTHPLTRRDFFVALAASAVAAKVPLPVSAGAHIRTVIQNHYVEPGLLDEFVFVMERQGWTVGRVAWLSDRIAWGATIHKDVAL